MNLQFNDVRYSGVDIGHQLASVGQFLNSAQSLQKDHGFTNIIKMTGNVIVRNGIAQTNNLQALLDVANVGITGNANLVTKALNLDVTAVLSKGPNIGCWKVPVTVAGIIKFALGVGQNVFRHFWQEEKAKHGSATPKK